MQQQDRPTQSIVSQWQWQRNYHYLRYAILAFFLIALGALPNWLQSEFLSLAAVGYFGMSLSLLCLVMDIRNYFLFRDEESFIRDVLQKPPYTGPIVTWTLTLFYIGSFLLFYQLTTQIAERQILLSFEGAKRLGYTSVSNYLVTKHKLIYLPNGWTKIRTLDWTEYLLKNEEIKEIRNLEKK